MAKAIRICSIDDCEKRVVGFGFCENHYRRFKAHGDPLAGRIKPQKYTPGDTCSVDGCESPVDRRGWCSKHYIRWWSSGDTSLSGTEPGALDAWIDAHVEYQGAECLPWPFGKSNDGYGRCGPEGAKTIASREMCRRAHGEPPTPRHEAAHSCGNGAGGCVNPNHLRWATPVENAADKVLHGTVARGTRQGSAKLKEADVIEIRLRAGTASHSVIAADYGVTRETVRDVISRKHWAWLE